MSKCSIVWLIFVVVVCSEYEVIVEGAEVVRDEVVMCHVDPLRAMSVEHISQGNAR